MNKQNQKWFLPVETAKEIKEYFSKSIPFRERKKLLEKIEMINWRKILNILRNSTKTFSMKIELNEQSELNSFEKSIVQFIIYKYLQDQINKIIYENLNRLYYYHTEKIIKEGINDLNHIIESVISANVKFQELIVDILKLNWSIDSEKKQLHIDSIQKRLSKYSGKKLTKKRAKLYAEILKRNDAYKKELGKSDYRLATHNVTKLYGKKLDNFYKAIDRFMDRNNIHTYDDFENSIYFTIVDK